MTMTTTETNASKPAPVSESAAIELAKTRLEMAKIPKSAAVEEWELLNRRANALANSTLVPKEYQGNVSNCLIAIQMAFRIGADPFMVMQNLDIIHGRPSWRAQFLIATVNASQRFSPLRFRFQGKEGSDDWGCRAVARDKTDGEECLGALITIKLAKAEGWVQKSGSKWQTMPEQMLQYRAAAFWVRVYCPELSMGIHTVEEVIDTVGVPVPESLTTASPRELEAALTETLMTADGDTVSAKTGEVLAEATPVEEPKAKPAKTKATREPGDD